MAIVIMIAGVLSTIVFHVNQYGVVLLQAVQPGLPRLIFPGFYRDQSFYPGRGKSTYGCCCDHGRDTFVREQFLHPKTDMNWMTVRKLAVPQEILVAGSRMLGPVNGSISRTSMNEQYGGKTQVVSITAGLDHGGCTYRCNRIYRISSGSGIDGNRNLCTDECCRDTFCSTLI